MSSKILSLNSDLKLRSNFFENQKNRFKIRSWHKKIRHFSKIEIKQQKIIYLCKITFKVQTHIKLKCKVLKNPDPGSGLRTRIVSPDRKSPDFSGPGPARVSARVCSLVSSKFKLSTSHFSLPIPIICLTGYFF